MVGEKRTRRFVPTGSTATTGELEMASRSGSTIRATSKTALRSGSSKQGKQRRGVDRLELGRGNCLGFAVGPRIGGPVEPPQLVVEGPGETAAQGAWTRGQLGRRPEDDPLELVVEGHRARNEGTVGRQDLDIAHGELGGVEHDVLDRLVDDGVDRHRAREGGGSDIGFDLDAVHLGLDGAGQAKCRIARSARRRRGGWVHPRKATCRAPSRFSLRARSTDDDRLRSLSIPRAR